jgi:hypothetical protein
MGVFPIESRILLYFLVTVFSALSRVCHWVVISSTNLNAWQPYFTVDPAQSIALKVGEGARVINAQMDRP